MNFGTTLLLLTLLSCSLSVRSQHLPSDTTSKDTNIVFSELAPIILTDKIDESDLINHLKKDTTFEKSFKNLNVLNYKAIINGKMYDKKGDNQLLSIKANMVQTKSGNCFTRKLEQKNIQGKMKNAQGEYLFLTCKIFGTFFLDEKTECGKTNLLKEKDEGKKFSSLSEVDKRINQIKRLLFNPGHRMPELFFFGTKVAIFENNLMRHYDHHIETVTRNGIECVMFKIRAKEDLNIFQRSDIVIDELTTWLNAKTWEIVAKKYTLSYDFGFVSFLSTMEVDVAKYKDYLHPTNIKYSGKWNVPFYKREDGVFSVLLYDFKD